MIETLPEVASIVLQDGETTSSPVLRDAGAGVIALGLAALGTGYAQRGIGAAAIGAVAEDGDNFSSALILTALPETLIIIAFVGLFLVL
jgi:V/A-type H+-transporting ATPase subunit K